LFQNRNSLQFNKPYQKVAKNCTKALSVNREFKDLNCYLAVKNMGWIRDPEKNLSRVWDLGVKRHRIQDPDPDQRI